MKKEIIELNTEIATYLRWKKGDNFLLPLELSKSYDYESWCDTILDKDTDTSYFDIHPVNMLFHKDYNWLMFALDYIEMNFCDGSSIDFNKLTIDELNKIHKNK